MDISGKVFAITGAGNGIAREVTLALVGRGARVAALDIDAEALAETVSLAGDRGDRISTHVVNIVDRKAVAKLPAAIIKKHGQVDALLNIAGIIQKFVPVNDLDYDQIDRVIDVNLHGTINTVKSFLPELLKRPEAALLNVSSMGAYAPVPGQSLYGATKAAVTQLTRGLHSELMATKVQVTCVFPGAIGTNIAQNSGIATQAEMEAMAAKAGAQRKTTSAVEAGRLIVEAIEKGSYEIFIGSDAKIMSRLSRLSPRRAAALIYKQMKDLLG